ncbi:GlcNAc transferase [Cavenderia fasciculata]|uniref:GlcNAc transferase n=1 Tax=Cavenderia fasciculata TaxID=261658 RepID=F4PSE7_CACFS|nr:GlcNAc transferase [Cavenderia fasciculata]EGG21477.1 GlcNAc transferase [Cavenderia fasciculata]|eukprot:XP_004359327.1 GlcNAc transferase [Cavenderia fasciculata]
MSQTDNTIFVSIASYRDPECQWTIKNLFENADQPDNVYIGVCWQYDMKDNQDQQCFVYTSDRFDKQVRRIDLHFTEAKGPCLARHLAQTLWKDEKYFLQIDSHMRFIKGWDSKLIEMIEQCPLSKPIITCYPMGYTLPNNVPKHTYPTVLVADRFAEDTMIRMTGKLISKPLKQPFTSRFWVSGFSFSSSAVIKEVPYDPHLDHLFFGEEMIMTARLWTSGWNFYSPPIALVFHLWKRDYRTTFRDDCSTPVHQAIQKEKEQQSRNRINHILQNQVTANLDTESIHYSLGSERTLEQYKQFSGVDLIKKEINQFAKLGGMHESDFLNSIIELAIKSQQGVPI